MKKSYVGPSMAAVSSERLRWCSACGSGSVVGQTPTFAALLADIRRGHTSNDTNNPVRHMTGVYANFYSKLLTSILT